MGNGRRAAAAPRARAPIAGRERGRREGRREGEATTPHESHDHTTTRPRERKERGVQDLCSHWRGSSGLACRHRNNIQPLKKVQDRNPPSCHICPTRNPFGEDMTNDVPFALYALRRILGFDPAKRRLVSIISSKVFEMNPEQEITNTYCLLFAHK